MTRCPITYEEIADGARYSAGGLKRLSRRLKGLQDLPYSAEDQRREAVARASKMSIQGVQPKLSAKLDAASETFTLVDTGGEYILKPQNQYPELPQNEDLTMRLAGIARIEVPVHGLIYSNDGSLTYVIKRFDRSKKIGRLHVEDFAQLSGKTRDTKYNSSMEQVAAVMDRFMTFPAIEKVKLFRLTVFNFLVGNEDMHLKNFSAIRRAEKVELSPAYDLINTTIAVGNVNEESALSIDGKKSNLSRRLFAEYYGVDRLGLPPKVVEEILLELTSLGAAWESQIKISFLSDAMKKRYWDLVVSRLRRLQG
jgi:serine/threonine-protein kinase HipA